MLSGLEKKAPHIKTEPEEVHSEEASQEDRAPGAWGWVPLSPGPKEKALFLPEGGRRGMWAKVPGPAAVGKVEAQPEQC